MARCTKTWGLEVHHKDRTDGNGLSNAEVLCTRCHEATLSYATPGVSPPQFSEDTKQAARRRAGNQCECTRTGGCH